jgi:hypothetical protein
MARTVNGVSTILTASRAICRVVGIFGTSAFALATNNVPEFAAAVTALVVACRQFDGLDDYAGQIDTSGPAGPEDPPPV